MGADEGTLGMEEWGMGDNGVEGWVFWGMKVLGDRMMGMEEWGRGDEG